MVISVATAEDFRVQFNVSRETSEKLEIYEEKLRQWQRAINLVSPKTLPSVWQRHFADSAQLFRFIPQEARSLVDLGSGAGFPGLVLAILAAEKKPDLIVTLIESDQRKSAFLRDVATATEKNVRVLSTRIETDASKNATGAVDIISARALAPLERLFRLSVPFCHPASVCLFPKGRSAAEEIAQARTSMRFDYELFESETDIEGRIVVARNISERSP